RVVIYTRLGPYINVAHIHHVDHWAVVVKLFVFLDNALAQLLVVLAVLNQALLLLPGDLQTRRADLEQLAKEHRDFIPYASMGFEQRRHQIHRYVFVTRQVGFDTKVRIAEDGVFGYAYKCVYRFLYGWDEEFTTPIVVTNHPT